jgi:L-iditol 2-dehydrogenase
MVSMKVAIALGAAEVIVTDVFPERLEIARKQGATRTVNVAQESLASLGLDADVLIECSGNNQALKDGLRSLRPGGRAVVVGMGPGEEASIPLSFLQNNEIVLTGIFRYANTYQDAIAMVAAGRIDLKSLVTSTYKLEDTEAALQAAKNDPTNLKPVVVP